MDRPTLGEIQMQANSIEETSFSYQRYRLHQDYTVKTLQQARNVARTSSAAWPLAIIDVRVTTPASRH